MPTIRPVRRAEVSPDPDLTHAFGTDPDGFLVAEGEGGAILGAGAGAVRGDTLQLVHLEVAPPARRRGIGSALLAALKGYGRERGARVLEVAAPAEPAALGLLLRSGLPLRTTALRLRAAGGDVVAGEAGERAGDWTLAPLGDPTAFSGWVADLDRQTRGFLRRPEWTRWLASPEASLVVLRRRGRPEGIARIARRGGVAHLGPVAARLPAAAAAALPVLARRAVAEGAVAVEMTIPSEARVLMSAAFGAGLAVSGHLAVFSTRARGDLRAYAASGGGFF